MSSIQLLASVLGPPENLWSVTVPLTHDTDIHTPGSKPFRSPRRGGGIASKGSAVWRLCRCNEKRFLRNLDMQTVISRWSYRSYQLINDDYYIAEFPHYTVHQIVIGRQLHSIWNGCNEMFNKESRAKCCLRNKCAWHLPCLPGLASCLYRPQKHLPSFFDFSFTLSRVTFTHLHFAHSISRPIKYLRLFLHIAKRNWREMFSFTVLLSKAVVTGSPGGCRISMLTGGPQGHYNKRHSVFRDTIIGGIPY